MKWLDFDPHVTFLKLKAVAFVIIAILVIAVLITLTIVIFTPNLSFNLSSAGWNNAIEIFKFPLGLLAVSIPLIALFAANHRSVQSKAQMELTQSNSFITTYYKHVEEFQKYVEGHVNKLIPPQGDGTRVAYPRKLHKILFPNARTGQLKIDKESMNALCSDIEKVIAATAVFRAENYEHRPTQLNVLNDKIDKFALKYCISHHRARGLPHFSEQGGLYTGSANVRDYILPFGEICKVLTESLLFDESLEMPEAVRPVHDFNWQGIPTTLIGSINYSFSKHLADDTMIMLDDEDF